MDWKEQLKQTLTKVTRGGNDHTGQDRIRAALCLARLETESVADDKLIVRLSRIVNGVSVDGP